MYSPRTVYGYPIPMQKPQIPRAQAPKTQAPRRGANKAQKTNQMKPQRVSAAPVAISTRTTSVQPKMMKTEKSFRVQHRELVSSAVNGSTTFTVQSYLRLNPGIAATFPWLAPQAASWDQYKIHRLAVEYVPTAPTSTAGEIFLSPNYDASDPQPTTETQAANNSGAVSDSCWQRIRLDLDPKAMMGLGPRRFVRPCNVAGDIKTFDVGTVAVCSNNMTGASAVGKLYIDYDVEFFLPQSDPSPSVGPLGLSFYRKAANQTFTTAVAAKITWDAAAFDPLLIGSGSTGSFTPPAGTYHVTMVIGMENTANEATTYRIFFAKNGVGTGLSNTQSVTNAAAGAGDITSLVCSECLSVNGSDTIDTWAVITGATGTLTVNGAQNSLSFELV